MKILVVTEYYFPEDFRINDICEGLVKKGHSVTVVTGIPNYPRGIVFEGYEKSYLKPETINGVTVIRCNNRPRKKGLFNLLLSYITYVRKAKQVIKKLNNEFDIVYAYQMSPISLVKPAILYKKKHHVPLYVYVCDVWPESVRDLGGDKPMSTHNPIYLYYKLMSKSIYKSADLIGVKCNEFIDYLENVCGVDRAKCSLNYEHAEQNYLKVKETPTDNKIIDFMYLGNLGHASNCDLILEAAALLEKRNFKIHFVGDGSEYNNLLELTKRLNLEEVVVFHGRVPQSEIIEYYNIADFCLLTLSGKTFIGLTPPAKLTGYMAACRPIIAAVDGAAASIIKEYKCGLVCPAGDANEYAKLMQNAIDNSEHLSELGVNGRHSFLSHFTLDKHIQKLEEALFCLINGKGL